MKQWEAEISNSGTMTIRQSTVSGNRSNDGGGILNRVGGTALITESTIADNTSATGFGDGNGGGIKNSGRLTIVNSTIARNVAHIVAFIGPAEGGGGIAARFGTVRIESCTISDNEVALSKLAGSWVAEESIATPPLWNFGTRSWQTIP